MYMRKNVVGIGVMSIAAAVVVLTVGSSVFGQQTRPAGDDAKADKASLEIHVWTCPMHGQFRMRGKGACPLCGMDLVPKQIALQGGEQPGDPYPLDRCIVTGRRLGDAGPPIIMMHDGREVRFCSKDCISKFEADTEGYLKQIDQKIIEQQVQGYPLTTCPVSGESLTSMGEPVNRVFNNRLVRFCCNGCVRGFKKNPAPHLATLDAAIVAQQKDDYPLTTCMISGMKLGSMGDPIEYIAANRLVRFCCAGCPKSFWKDPATYLDKLDKAWQEKHGGKSHESKPQGETGEHEHGEHEH